MRIRKWKLIIILFCLMILASCSSTSDQVNATEKVSTEESKSHASMDNQTEDEETFYLPSNYILTDLLQDAQEATRDLFCKNNGNNYSKEKITEILSPYYASEHIQPFLEAFVHEDLTHYCHMTASENEESFLDFIVNDFNENEIRFSLEKQLNVDEEYYYYIESVHVIKEDENWLIKNIEINDADVVAMKNISDTINQDFFQGTFNAHTDTIGLVKLLDSNTSQVLTIQNDDEYSVVRVFNYDTKEDKWTSVFENNEHEHFNNMETLRIFDIAPIALDSENEQAIIGLQTGSGANLSFNILGANEGVIDYIFSFMDYPLSETTIKKDGKELVLDSFQPDFPRELTRFNINQTGEVVYGYHLYGFPAKPEDTLLFKNDELGFSFELPESFKNNYIVTEVDSEWFKQVPLDSPLTMYSFGLVNEGIFIQNVFQLAVIEESRSNIDPFYVDGMSPFSEVLMSTDQLTLIAVYPGELHPLLYEEPYLEIGKQVGAMWSDIRSQLADSIILY